MPATIGTPIIVKNTELVAIKPETEPQADSNSLHTVLQVIAAAAREKTDIKTPTYFSLSKKEKNFNIIIRTIASPKKTSKNSPKYASHSRPSGAGPISSVRISANTFYSSLALSIYSLWKPQLKLFGTHMRMSLYTKTFYYCTNQIYHGLISYCDI